MNTSCQTPCGPHGSCDFWTQNGCLLLAELYLDDYLKLPETTGNTTDLIDHSQDEKKI